MILKVTPVDQAQFDSAQEWVPLRSYHGDAGYDLFCQETVLVQPGGFLDIDCGVKIELPQGWWGMLTGRSSTLRKRGLLVHTGIIDNGYRGPLFAGVWNLTQERVRVEAGERLAQLIPVPIFQGGLMVANSLSPSSRGTNGFGSSGV